jgi:methylmalonyl-CoA mutase N-terminal domain/subunit
VSHDKKPKAHKEDRRSAAIDNGMICRVCRHGRNKITHPTPEAAMTKDAPWLFRTYAGHSTAAASNAR